MAGLGLSILHVNHPLFYILSLLILLLVCFLISFLLPANCSYLDPWTLPFEPPVLFSSPLLWGGTRGGGRASEGLLVWSVSVGTLNGGVPYLSCLLAIYLQFNAQRGATPGVLLYSRPDTPKCPFFLD